MNAYLAIGDERTLRRIMALLAALAVLAERVAVRSLPVRWLVLCILRRAETVAGEYVFEAAGMPPVIEGLAAVGNGPADALRLAARLHALAAALGALLLYACRFDRRSARRGFAFGDVTPGSSRSLGCWRPKLIDTS
jgi:hypothetical protein